MSLAHILAGLAFASSAAALPAQPLATTITLCDIQFSSSEVYSTPAHLATYGGNLQFNIDNLAIPYITRCSASARRPPDYFYAENVYDCVTPAGFSGGAASFTFNRPDNSFTVNQTWEEESKHYLVVGSGTAELSCQSSQWTNPNWTIGQIYTTYNTDCQPASLIVPVNISVWEVSKA